MSDILESYEKDLLHRAGITQKELLFLEPEEIYGEVKERIPLERCTEIRGLVQLTSLKGLTAATARILYAAGIRTRWDLLQMKAQDVVARVNEDTETRWGEKEKNKIGRILEKNEELLEEL